jgi:hypothetical protein
MKYSTTRFEKMFPGGKVMKKVILLVLALLFSFGVSLSFADEDKGAALTKRAESAANLAEESAKRANMAAQIAETAAIKAEMSAEKAEKAADKATAIFEQKSKK